MGNEESNLSTPVFCRGRRLAQRKMTKDLWILMKAVEKTGVIWKRRLLKMTRGRRGMKSREEGIEIEIGTGEAEKGAAAECVAMAHSPTFCCSLIAAT